ncbi:MAG: DNA primase small subunit domain-containing protein [Candidatus Bathyarchaeia archaeon]|jgi:hypothetical protein
MKLNQDFWRAWFGFHAGREAGNPHRTFLQNVNSLLPYIQEREAKCEPCFLSVQPYRARDQVYGLDRLFFDFDSKEDLPSLDKAWKETRHFVSALKRFYDLTPLIVFSGRRGYHVYVWLWQVVEFKSSQKALAKEIYALLQKKLLKGLKYETLDPEVLGDIKRLARVPYTIHEKSGLLCEPVTQNRQSLLVLPPALDGYRKHGIQEELFRKLVEEVKLTRKIEESRKRRRIIIRLPTGSHIRPCITEALQTSLDGEYGHLMRLAIAVEYLNNGYTIDKIVPLFQTQEDFDAKKTRAMVEHAKKRGYKPRKRETLQKYGFCHGQRCTACLKAGRIVP